METACGVKVSMDGSLDTKFVISSLILASTLKGPSDLTTDAESARFI